MKRLYILWISFNLLLLYSLIFFQTPEYTEMYSCTGFFINQNGDFASAGHCAVAKNYSVYLEGKEYRVQLVARDADSDVSIFHVDYKNSDYLPLQIDFQNNSLSATYGYPVPQHLGFYLHMTLGRLSKTWYPPEIHSNALICPGNSGGPIISQSGGVVGTVKGAFNWGIVDKDHCSTAGFGPSISHLIDLANEYNIKVYITTKNQQDNKINFFDLKTRLRRENVVILFYGW